MTAITVYTQFPTTEFISDVTGVGPILSTGSTIDDSQLAAVQAAALLTGVTVIEGIPPGGGSPVGNQVRLGVAGGAAMLDVNGQVPADELGNAPSGGRTSPVVDMTVSGTATLDWSQGDADVTMTANTEFTLANLDVGDQMVVTLRGIFSPTFPTVVWPISGPPVFNDNDGDGTTYIFFSTKAGEVRGAAIL